MTARSVWLIWEEVVLGVFTNWSLGREHLRLYEFAEDIIFKQFLPPSKVNFKSLPSTKCTFK